MNATNYARQQVAKRDNGKPVEYRFFTAEDEVPPALRLAPWVWWRIPRGFHEVRLVGEGKDERCVRLGHGPGECEACRSMKQRGV
jgi:hypothetical protein